MDDLDARNRLILRRTLSAIAWICAVWCLLLGAPVLEHEFAQVRRQAWFLVARAALLAAAGVGLWKPRRWGWPATALAALACAASAVGADRLEAAVVDALFPVCAAGIYVKAREPRLDRGSGQG